MLTSGTGLGALRAAVSVYYNYTGQAGACFGFGAVLLGASRHWRRLGRHDLLLLQARRRAGQLRATSLPEFVETQAGWDFQCCTEVYQPMPTNGITDFELPSIPNKTAYFARCAKHRGVTPRPEWEEMTFMGEDIAAGSNIFLSSGQLDPWRAAGIQARPKGAPDSIVVRIIEGAAHHLDLRAAHPADPPAVTAVRKEQRVAIGRWVAEWAANQAS